MMQYEFHLFTFLHNSNIFSHYQLPLVYLYSSGHDSASPKIEIKKFKCLTFLINDNFFLFITMNSNNNHLKFQKPNPNICLQRLKRKSYILCFQVQSK